MHAAAIHPGEGSDLELLDFALAHAPWRGRNAASRAATAASDETDEALMSAYGRGDSHAFRTLYLRYHEKLHRYLLRLAAGPEEAEEVFQDVWISIIRGRERYEPRAPFAAWLFSIAHRRAADRWRELGRHAPDAGRRADGDGEGLEDLLPAITHTPERDAGSQALGQALLEAIAQLPLPQREAFLLRAEGDLSLDDIAAATGVSRETAKSRLRYAHNRLRAALEDWR
jgi:RNA polymerase sigma-70 factor (ECF subfamily)